MLLTELILSKDNVLSQVWIAAHYERKLSKQQALKISVQDSVDDILRENAEPTALRMSGQLMLGVVRIYSRKTQYLFDDCKDVRDKITMAFRPGQVDLPAEQLIANKNAITYTERRNEYDIMMSDLNMNMSWNEIAKNFQPLGLHLANEADITLPRAHYAASARSSSISRESEYESQRGRAGTAEPFEEGIDLGLNLGNDLGDLGDISVEFGREAGVERAPSVASGMQIGGRASSVLTDRTARSATAELGGSVLGAGELLAASRGDLDLELEAPGDLGLDLGEGFDLPPLEDDVQMQDVQGFEGIADEEAEIQARARRESTALSPPPPEVQESIMADITPRTANRIAHLAETREKAAAANAARKTGPKKHVRIAAAFDEDIEQEEDETRGAARRDISSILGKENYIPANEAEIALARIQEDPAAFYNPTIQKGNQTFFMATPAGISMAPELSTLFMIPTNVLRRRRDGPESPSRKRARLGEAAMEDDEEIEAARREQRALSERLPADFQLEDITFDMDARQVDIQDEPMGFDNLGMARDSSVRAPSMLKSPTPALARERLMSEARSLRAPSLAPSVMQSPDDCAIGFFDARTRVNGAPLTESQSQSQTAASQYYGEDEASQADARQRGFSQNTVKAVGFLRSEFSNEDGEIDEGKTISFQEKAKKASKRAAASFFFELLVLGTRDCVKLDQPERYGDISVQAKPKLFDGIAPSASQAVNV
ncbi:Electron transfer flavoprotein alpha-subunit [Naganishia albida]|nr:Electron transfer flavoprotein alpha-subunit [Naganishia albida]